MEDLGEAGIFIVVSDVCYLLAWDMPNVVREMMSFLYVVVRVFSHSASYATPRPKRLRGCAFLRYIVNRFYGVLVRPKSELITRLGIAVGKALRAAADMLDHIFWRSAGRPAAIPNRVFN